jgi:mRNA interferase HigB
VTVFGEAVAAKFAKRHAASRKPLARFLAIVRAANWPHFPAVKQSFPSADYAPSTGTVVFDIGGNKYRLIAIVHFERQAMLIQEVLTHEQYDRENL